MKAKITSSTTEEGIRVLSSLDGSPCNKCVINAVCKKSFIDGSSACEELAEFIVGIFKPTLKTQDRIGRTK